MSNNVNNIRYEKIGSLSLLKFLLALLVFLFHWNIHFSVLFPNDFVNKFVNAGASAMSGFFILSGFLLFYIYSKKDLLCFENLKNFYLKRAIKILPSTYFYAILMYSLHVFIAHKPMNWIGFTMQIIPLQAYFPHLFKKIPLNGGLWFISVILFLYFLFPLLCVIVKSVKHILIFALCIYLLGIFPSIVNCYYPHWSLYHLPYFRICEFIMGMITARFVLNFNKTYKYGSLYSLLIFISIFLGIGMLYSNNFFNHVRFKNNYMYYDVILLILYPALVYFLSSTKDKIFSIITQNKLVEYLGNISYSFYLTQGICIFIVARIKPYNYYGLSSMQLLLYSFILNVIFSAIMYEIIEKRISKRLLKFVGLSK